MATLDVKMQKYLLNSLVILCFLIVCLLFMAGLYIIWFDTPDLGPPLESLTIKIGISVILIWFMILMPYLAWSVYFYNINQGLTNEEWSNLKRRNQEKEALGEVDPDQVMEDPKNPYQEETFGLPKGTIRGTLAITLMMGALALFIVAIGQPHLLRDNEFFHENFEFIKTAFLMMIAFYFGSKSLEYLQNRWTIDKGSPQRQPQGIRENDARNILPQPNTGKVSVFPSETYASPAVDKTPTDLREEQLAELEEGKMEKPDDDIENLLIIKDEEKEKQKNLSEVDIVNVAKDLGVEVPALRAVIDIESAGSGFLADGRPKILFEGHIFYRKIKTPQKYAAQHPDIVYEKWTKKHYIGGAGEYARYEKAALIDEKAAKLSTSWGLFQIMGFNHEICGFKTVDEFVEKMYLNEHEHLKAFCAYCKSRDLIKHLKSHDWAAFARRYNGPGYAQNKYDEKLEFKYHHYSKIYNDNLCLKVIREKENDKQTLGTMYVFDGKQEIFSCKTLELPWRNNQRNISCIPTTSNTPYKVKKRWTAKYKNHFHIQNVPGRSFILIHSGNYFSHTLGCILVGQKHSDINDDGYADVINSRLTLAKLYEIMPDQFEIHIESKI